MKEMKQNAEESAAPSLLESIRSPSDLRALTKEQLDVLACEIRTFLVEKTAERGGHLASNLGVVELSLALHRVFDSPSDSIVFDVGHQSYVHKILTGRRELFDTLRLPGGLSGFTKRSESEHDPFGAGHSSTSISAALGIARARALAGDTHTTVAVVGDGAMTGGMIHEALNNCDPSLRLVIVINENEMSIAPTTGAYPHLIAQLRISRSYNRMKRRTSHFLTHIPLIGRPLNAALKQMKNLFRSLLIRPNYFEELGLVYLGPFDGNDESVVERALEEAKAKECCVVVHVRTKKGKGYLPAECDPQAYHSVSPIHAGETFHQVFGQTLVEMAENDARICAVTPATGDSTGLTEFARLHPDRYFDVGIAEEHAVTFSAGLAASGLHPYAVIYSSFLQRAYDNILHDVALQNLPVRLIVDRASLAVSDGATHHGIFDVAFLSHIPSLRLYAPATFGSLRAILHDTVDFDGPVVIRYPNAGEDEDVRRTFYGDGRYDCYGVRCDYRMGDELACVVISYGHAAPVALSAVRSLREGGLPVGMILLETLKPYDETAKKLSEILPESVPTVFLEEGVYAGGAGMLTFDALNAIRPDLTRRRILAVKDTFASPTVLTDLYDYCGISRTSVMQAVSDLLSRP